MTLGMLVGSMRGRILCGRLEILERLSNCMGVYYAALRLRA